MVRAGAGTGKTTVLVERFVRAVVEDERAGRGDAGDHVHREGRGRDAHARARPLRRARPPPRGACGRGRLDLDDPRLLRARPARPRAQRRHRPRLPRARRARGGADRRRRLRRRAPGVHGHRSRAPGDGGRLHAGRAARHGPHRLLAPAQPGGAAATAGGAARAPPGRRAGAPERGRRRARLRELGAAGGGASVGRAIDEARALRRPARARARRRAGGAGRARGAVVRPQRQGALHRRPASSTATRWPPTPRSAASTRSTATTACCARCSSSTASATSSGKRARSALDFEDLELLARDLLAEHDGLRQQYAERFAHVLVDEFQDTNPLQNELLEQLDRDNLFRVGDENQSIYGFRNADVEVFRRHWADGRRRRARREHHRELPQPRRGARGDRPLLHRLWPDGFEPLAGGRRRRAAAARRARAWSCSSPTATSAAGTTRSGSTTRSAPRCTPPRRGARRRRGCSPSASASCAPQGGWEWRDIVLLFRATTHMSFYERALEERGIPTHVVGGRGYWAQQQVADLRHWLAALANPLDELAVYSVLASPLARAVARRRGPDRAGGQPHRPRPLVAAAEPRRAGAICSRPRTAAAPPRSSSCSRPSGARRPQVSLETLIDRAVTRTGYDRHILVAAAAARAAWPTCAS